MAGDCAGNRTFLPGVDRWIEGLGRLRDVVRQQVVAAQIAETLNKCNLTSARVLDVGCGQGSQALSLARAGHEVTGLDISVKLLAVFRAALHAEPAAVQARVQLIEGPGEAAAELTTGSFDVVLCHGVLGYLADPASLIAAVSRVTAQRAILSLLCRNGLATAMRDGLQGKWSDAVASFDSRDYVNRLGLAARAHTPDELDAVVSANSWRREDWYGVRIFTDHLEEEAPAEDELSALVAAEYEAGHRDPYRQVAALLHVVYSRSRARP